MYVGSYYNGQYHNLGKYSWPDGSYFEGNWNNGERYGYGEMYNASSKQITRGIWYPLIIVTTTTTITTTTYTATFTSTCTTTAIFITMIITIITHHL